ncbi:hypothetical protein FRC04_003230 [Tulasnella sp. 424]|nr:hypothetical protein FRC04_003230 [Tulasnella sp. 424]
MSIKPASDLTIDSASQCLLKSIESESILPVGLLVSDWQQPRESIKYLDANELRAGISETAERLKLQLLHSVSAAFRRHNSFLPIQRLPPEILSASIAHTMADIECHNHQQRLIQLSTVSSWWREVTLGTPSLWGVISSKDPEWIVSLALERSKDTPLTVLYEGTSYSSNLHGGSSYRDSIGPGGFFVLVTPHAARWADATLPLLGSTDDSIEWLKQHPIQLSQHLRRLNLGWDGAPTTDNAITRFSGHAEHLRELKLSGLHVSPTNFLHTLGTSRQILSLDLDSLVVSSEQVDSEPPEHSSAATPIPIDLPCLTKLSLRSLPPSILGPIVESINASNLETVSISYVVIDGNADKPSEPFASFTARLIATTLWVLVEIRSDTIILKPLSPIPPLTTCNYNLELRGEASEVLQWLRFRSLSQMSKKYSVELYIDSSSLDQAVIDKLMHFPEVAAVHLFGCRESWRWIWLLSLPDAVQTESGDSKPVVKSWLWPKLEYLMFYGDYVNEFTILSALLTRYGSRSSRGSDTKMEGVPRRLLSLKVCPGGNVWRAEVLDRIRELVGPGCFKWEST